MIRIKPLLYGMGLGVILCTLYFMTLIPKTDYAKGFSAIKEAIIMATTVKPETFTELYFENHTQLPDKVTRLQKYSFSFTIHNLEYQDMEYPYTVYLQRDNEKTILTQGSVSLKHDESKTIQDTVGPFKNLRTKIVVELTNKNQIISYWLDKADKTSPTSTPSPSPTPLPSPTPTPTPITVLPSPVIPSTLPVIAMPSIIQPKKDTQPCFYPHRPLPFLINPSNNIINISFKIDNPKNIYSIISYEVYMNTNGQITQIDNNQINLKQNKAKTITKSYSLTNPISLFKNFVKLPTDNNYLYFNIKLIQ